MSWFHLGGLNPKFKSFAEKHPDATMLGLGWALYWRFAVIVLLVEGFLFAVLFSFGLAFGGFDHHRGDYMYMHKDWSAGPGAGVPMQGKLNIDAVCQGALAYMTFPDAASSEAFVQDCKDGKHPEVMERYKADMNLGEGATI